jgi:hypothetical protein
MATKKRVGRPRGATGTLAMLRRRAEAMMGQLRRAGMKQIKALDGQIAKLNRQRQALLAEVGLGGGKTAARGRRGRSRAGARSRVDWNQVFTKLPKTSFKASDVRAIIPDVSPGTLSQRLTGWVNEKKLKRSGSRRGTRYTRT